MHLLGEQHTVVNTADLVEAQSAVAIEPCDDQPDLIMWAATITLRGQTPSAAAGALCAADEIAQSVHAMLIYVILDRTKEHLAHRPFIPKPLGFGKLLSNTLISL
jgi:hypothetical protein